MNLLGWDILSQMEVTLTTYNKAFYDGVDLEQRDLKVTEKPPNNSH